METIGITHIGRVRKNNEDSILLECEHAPYYVLVADGMGGHAAGEIASRAACDFIKEYIDGLAAPVLSQEDIKQAVLHANRRIVRMAEKDETLKGMGTTLTLAYLNKKHVTIAQIGDSRAYHFSGKALCRLTKDHTYVQKLIDGGYIKDASDLVHPLSNIITRAMGMRALKVDFFDHTWESGDILLLCTDGLSAYVDDEDIKSVLQGGGGIDKKAQQLVDMALDAGGKDNISVILARSDQEEAYDG